MSVYEEMIDDSTKLYENALAKIKELEAENKRLQEENLYLMCDCLSETCGTLKKLESRLAEAEVLMNLAVEAWIDGDENAEEEFLKKHEQYWNKHIGSKIITNMQATKE